MSRFIVKALFQTNVPTDSCLVPTHQCLLNNSFIHVTALNQHQDIVEDWAEEVPRFKHGILVIEVYQLLRSTRMWNSFFSIRAIQFQAVIVYYLLILSYFVGSQQTVIRATCRSGC